MSTESTGSRVEGLFVALGPWGLEAFWRRTPEAPNPKLKRFRVWVWGLGFRVEDAMNLEPSPPRLRGVLGGMHALQVRGGGTAWGLALGFKV